MKFTEIQTFTLDRDRRIELRVLWYSLSLIRAIYNYGSFSSLLPSISIRVLQFASDESLRDEPRKIPAGCDRTESSPSKLLILYSRAGSTISPFESRWDRDYQRHDSRNELEKYNGLYLGIDRSNVFLLLLLSDTGDIQSRPSSEISVRGRGHWKERNM